MVPSGAHEHRMSFLSFSTPVAAHATVDEAVIALFTVDGSPDCYSLFSAVLVGEPTADCGLAQDFLSE